ncbi:MAG: TonB C-terminal domain-containing protein [Phycisphaerae bacterium]|nr:TonB C-terminal domain-containing protein [Gemmatimonadaceae bacterium]
MAASHQPAFVAPAGGEPSTNSSLRKWLVISAALHLSGAAAFIVWKGIAPPARPPVYRVELIGAPGLKRQAGIVGEQPAVTEPAATPAKAPAAAERPPETVKKPPPPKKAAEKPVPKPVTATPNVTKEKEAAPKAIAKTPANAAPPVAGSGDVKARGTDVTTMIQQGIDFPFPGYVNNIIRRLVVEFGDQPNTNLTVEFKFLIHRDGSVSEITLVKGSGRTSFDREARGAIEAVGNARGFGPLPSGFNDDVLPVYYTFAPAKPST